MATITIDDQALADADAFLTAFLTEKVPDADFSKGSVTRDFVITAIAYIFAFLESERKTTRDQQSLLSLSTQTDDQSVQDAVNALLSNWFINRKTGQTARLTATLHFSAAADVPLTPATRFFRTADLPFVPDAPTSFIIPASSLVPTFNADNVVTDYTTTVNLVAQQVGTAFNVPAGRFLQADQFSPFFTYAENQSAIEDGRNVESTAELLDRAPTAVTVRNLINSRSIDTVLRETFSGVSRVLSIGFGDPEMLRDFANESVTRLRMHVGGFMDIYVQLPVTEVVETGALGGPFTRPDNVIATFKDATANFLAGPAVVPGDILRVVSVLLDVPREYIINTVTTTTLTVSPRAAFSAPLDETGQYCSYTIGYIAPNFDDKRSVTAGIGTGGQTSRVIQTTGRITLQGRPHYRIKKVELFLATTPATVEVITSRVNTPPAPGEFRVISITPQNAQSGYAVDQVDVNLTGHSPGDPWQMRVTYDTLVGYNDVQSYVVDRFQRVLAANPLVKGYIPVYLKLAFAYRIKIGSATGPDEEAMSQDLATFIKGFDLTQTLDLSAIQQRLKDQFPTLGVIVSPTVLTYDLFAPDGQVFSYSTKDIVSVYPSYPENNAQLTNGADLRSTDDPDVADPITNATLDPTVVGNAPLLAAANEELKNRLTLLGLSDRLLIYLTTAEDITFTLVP